MAIRSYGAGKAAPRCKAVSIETAPDASCLRETICLSLPADNFALRLVPDYCRLGMFAVFRMIPS